MTYSDNNIARIDNENGLTLITLPNGRVIGLDRETVVLYPCEEAVFDCYQGQRPTIDLGQPL